MRRGFISVLALALALLAGVGTLAGSTIAWFTESVVSGVNTIQSGVLDVEMNYRFPAEVDGWKPVEPDTPLIDPAKLHMPGSIEVVFLQAENVDNLALKYQFGVTALNSVVGKSVLGADIRLSEYLQVGMWHLDEHTGHEGTVKTGDMATLDGKSVKVTEELFQDRAKVLSLIRENPGKMKPLLDYGTTQTAQFPLEGEYILKGAVSVEDTQNPPSVIRDTDNYALVFYLPYEVDNVMNFRGVQPQLTLGIHLHATQATVESDSFGIDYDINAEQPPYPNPADLLEAHQAASGEASGSNS